MWHLWHFCATFVALVALLCHKCAFIRQYSSTPCWLKRILKLTKNGLLFCFSTFPQTGIKTASYGTDCSLESSASTSKSILGDGTDIFPWGLSFTDALKVRCIWRYSRPKQDTIALSFLRDKSHRTLRFASSICPSNFTVSSRARSFQVSLSKENTEIKICLKSERFLITSGFHELPSLRLCSHHTA